MWLRVPGYTQPKSVDSYTTWKISPCKKSKISKYWSSPSRDVYNQRILQSDWTRALWHLACEVEFSQIWRFLMKIKYFVHDNYRLFPAKSNAKIYQNSRNLHILDPFGTLFALFRTNKSFYGKSSLVNFLFLDFYWCTKFQTETNEQIPRKTDNRQMGGRKNKHDSIGITLPGFDKRNLFQCQN